VFQQLLTYQGGNVSFGIVKQRSYIILEGTPSSALVVDETGLAIFQEDIAGLEIPVKEVRSILLQQEFNKGIVVVLQVLLIEGNAGQFQEVVLEVTQVPLHALAVKAGSRIAKAVVESLSTQDLEFLQFGENLLIG